MEPIDIYQLWLAFLAFVNTQQGGWVKPQGNFQLWVNEISLELFREKIKSFETSQQISDDLAPFRKTVNVVLSGQQGKNYDLAPYPVDYAYYVAARVFLNTEKTCGCLLEGKDIFSNKEGKCKSYEDPDYAAIREAHRGEDLCEESISKVTSQMWGDACKHAFKIPTPSKAILTQFDSGFKVMPSKLAIIVLDYLKNPRKAVFAYTLGTDDNIVYDAANSVQLEWPVSTQGEFLARLVKRYGMFVREESMYGMGEQERVINQ